MKGLRPYLLLGARTSDISLCILANAAGSRRETASGAVPRARWLGGRKGGHDPRKCATQRPPEVRDAAPPEVRDAATPEVHDAATPGSARRSDPRKCAIQRRMAQSGWRKAPQARGEAAEWSKRGRPFGTAPASPGSAASPPFRVRHASSRSLATESTGLTQSSACAQNHRSTSSTIPLPAHFVKSLFGFHPDPEGRQAGGAAATLDTDSHG